MVNAKALLSSLSPYGFEYQGTFGYGVWRDYALGVKYSSGNDYVLEFAVRTEKGNTALRTAVHNTLRQQLGKSLLGVINNGDSFLFTLRFDGKSDAREQFFKFADAIVAVLKENGLSPADTCQFCRGGTPESLCFTGSFQPVHSACVQQKTEKDRSEVEENQQNGSYLIGLVGALLGALVGAIPAVAALVLTDTLYAILFALVPLASMYGYRLLKGKNNKISIVIVILCSLLAVFAMIYAGLVIYFMKETGFSLSRSLSYINDFLDFSDFMELAGESYKCFIFMFLGIFISWSYLNKTGQSEVHDAEALQSTLRPNPRYASRDAQPDPLDQEVPETRYTAPAVHDPAPQAPAEDQSSQLLGSLSRNVNRKQ